MKFFNPAIKIMGNLRFSKKFILVSTVFLIPVCIILGFLFLGEQDKLTTKSDQSIGIEYNNLLSKMTQHTQEHRGMASVYLNGNAAFRAELDKKEAELASDIAAIDAKTESSKDIIKSTQQWDEIKSDMTALNKDLNGLLPADSFDRHTRIIQKILNYGESVSNETKLVLQDDIPKYSMVIMNVKELPKLTEKMGQARAKGAIVATKGEMLPEEKKQIETLASQISASMADVQRSSLALMEDKRLEGELKASYEKAVKSVEGLLASMDKNFINSEKISVDSKSYFDSATASINDVYEYYGNASKVLDSSAKSDVTSAKIQIGVMGIGTLLFFLIIAYLFMGFYLSMNSTVKSIQVVANEFANGNLRHRIKVNVKDETGEIAESFNMVAESFSNIIGKSKDMAGELSHSAEMLLGITESTTNASQNISESMVLVMEKTAEQMEDTESVTSAMNQIANSVQDIAANSSQVAAASSEMSKAVDMGYKGLKTLSEKMDNVQLKVEESGKVINKLESRSRDIGQIIETIETIANETNLLALNAAIEAARAGEHGRGFSVVAEQVKKLAEESRISTEKVSVLIEHIRNDTDLAVERMQSVVEQTKDSVDKIGEVEKAFMSIKDSSVMVTNQIMGISAATEEISAGAEEVAATLNSVNEVAENNSNELREVSSLTQEQLGAMEEASASAFTLNEKANELDELTSMYSV